MPSDTVVSLTREELRDPAEAIYARNGRNLRRLRTRRGYSLDRLAKVSGVSRAMLARSKPARAAGRSTCSAKIATALEVSCGSLIIEEDEPAIVLLTRASSKPLTSHDGKFETRALFPYDGDRTVEFYELRIAPHHSEHAGAHRDGTVEDLVVAQGTVEVLVGKQPPRILGEGDALIFEADVPQYLSQHDGGTGRTLPRLDLSRDNTHIKKAPEREPPDC